MKIIFLENKKYFNKLIATNIKLILLIIIVNAARFDEANKYKPAPEQECSLIKLYFTRKNDKKNILENTSSSTIKLNDTILNFTKNDKIYL